MVAVATDAVLAEAVVDATIAVVVVIVAVVTNDNFVPFATSLNCYVDIDSISNRNFET